jgi:hypothetical protein
MGAVNDTVGDSSAQSGPATDGHEIPLLELSGKDIGANRRSRKVNAFWLAFAFLVLGLIAGQGCDEDRCRILNELEIGGLRVRGLRGCRPLVVRTEERVCLINGRL